MPHHSTSSRQRHPHSTGGQGSFAGNLGKLTWHIYHDSNGTTQESRRKSGPMAFPPERSRPVILLFIPTRRGILDRSRRPAFPHPYPDHACFCRSLRFTCPLTHDFGHGLRSDRLRPRAHQRSLGDSHSSHSQHCSFPLWLHSSLHRYLSSDEMNSSQIHSHRVQAR